MSSLFWKRLGEQSVATGAGAFVATLTANASASMARVLLLSGIAAAVRAAYGILTARLGVDAEQPSVK